LTGCRRSDRSTLQGRDEERAFPVRTRNWQGKGRKKEAWRGEQRAAAQPAGNDTAGVEIFFLRAPVRRSCDVLDFGPLWGRKTNTGVLSFLNLALPFCRFRPLADQQVTRPRRVTASPAGFARAGGRKKKGCPRVDLMVNLPPRGLGPAKEL